MKNYEIHFAEGSYFIAKIEGTKSGIIDNTFTEPIGKFKTNEQGIQDILNMLTKAYQLQKDFPLEELVNEPVETTNEQPILLCPNCERFQECSNCGISEPNINRHKYLHKCDGECQCIQAPSRCNV